MTQSYQDRKPWPLLLRLYSSLYFGSQYAINLLSPSCYTSQSIERLLLCHTFRSLMTHQNGPPPSPIWSFFCCLSTTHLLPFSQASFYGIAPWTNNTAHLGSHHWTPEYHGHTMSQDSSTTNSTTNTIQWIQWHQLSWVSRLKFGWTQTIKCHGGDTLVKAHQSIQTEFAWHCAVL